MAALSSDGYVSLCFSIAELWLLQGTCRHEIDGQDRWKFPPASKELTIEIALAINACVEGKLDEYCVAEDTRILTPDLRWVTAKSLSVGDKVLGFDETNGVWTKRYWRQATVLSANTISLPGYAVLLDSGERLICTREHRWLTYDKKAFRWRRTDELQFPGSPKGNQATQLVKLLDVRTPVNDYTTGYLAAAFDGEGWLIIHRGRFRGLAFAQRDNEMLAEVRQASKKLGFSLREQIRPSITELKLTRRAEALELLSIIRPKRLISNFARLPSLGQVIGKRSARVVSVSPIGPTNMITLATDTKTFVAEGFGAHNTLLLSTGDLLVLDYNIRQGHKNMEGARGQDILLKVFHALSQLALGYEVGGDDQTYKDATAEKEKEEGKEETDATTESVTDENADTDQDADTES